MNDQIDESIPVLTEIIASPDGKVVGSKTKTAEAHFPLLATTSSSAQVNPANVTAKKANNPIVTGAKDVLAQPMPATSVDANTDAINTEEWKALEQTVRENVLRQVLSRVDFVLEHRVSDSLAEVLQTAVDRLAEEIRAGLRHSIEEVVTRAITQELTKIKSSNRSV